MNTNDVFQFNAFNGELRIGVVIEADWDDVHARNTYIVYSNNSIVRMSSRNDWVEGVRVDADLRTDYVIVAYAILPDYDEKLADFKHYEEA